VLYDYGCVWRPADAERLALLRLIRATMSGGESPWPLLVELGFNPEFLEPMAARLPALCRALFEPFTAEYPYDMADWKLGQRVGDILGDDRWNFRIAGPPGLIFLMRAFHGLKYYLQGLAAPIGWQRAIEPILADLSGDMQRLRLPDATTQVPAADFATLARYLKICVREHGRVKVELTSYASGIDHLTDVLDDDLRDRIAAHHIDLPGIVADVRRRGYAPGPVFTLQESGKQIDVWLE
jgi:hypothetical protein